MRAVGKDDDGELQALAEPIRRRSPVKRHYLFPRNEHAPPDVAESNTLLRHEHVAKRRSHHTATEHDGQEAERHVTLDDREQSDAYEREANDRDTHSAGPVEENHRRSRVISACIKMDPGAVLEAPTTPRFPPLWKRHNSAARLTPSSERAARRGAACRIEDFDPDEMSGGIEIEVDQPTDFGGIAGICVRGAPSPDFIHELDVHGVRRVVVNHLHGAVTLRSLVGGMS